MTITNSGAGTNVHEISEGIFRISTPVPPNPALPGGFTFNQFLVVDDEPLLFRESPFAPGDRREAHFTRDVDMLIFRLGGLDLSRAETVEFAMRDERSGLLLTASKNAAFDRGAGDVLLCCQRHYADLPPDVVVEVRVHAAGGTEQVAQYTILHRFE